MAPNLSTALMAAALNDSSVQYDLAASHNHHIHEHAAAKLAEHDSASAAAAAVLAGASGTEQSIWTDQVSQTKVLSSLVLFTITLLCGYLPVRVLLNQDYIQYAMFAGGGVLMATAFCHLIPETHDNYKQHLAGLASAAAQHSHLALEPEPGAAAALITGSGPPPNASLAEAAAAATPPAEPAPEGLNVPYLEVTLCCGFFFMYLVEQLMARFINNHSHEHPCDTSTGQLVGAASSSGATMADAHSHTGNMSSAASTGAVGQLAGARRAPNLYKFLRGLLIVSSFGAHAIFDGVAIGLQPTVEKVWTIFLAISCHKLIIAAVVGLELYAATLESHLWTLVHLAIFSAMSPIGILIMVLTENSLQLSANHPSMIFLQSFATGTLLYIVFVEILQPKEDQVYEKNKLGKSISLIAGFALMICVTTLIDE